MRQLLIVYILVSLSRLSDYLLCDIGGDFLVAFEVEGEAAASLSGRTQSDWIIHHLSLRHLCLYGGVALFAVSCFHAEHTSAALVEVTDNVAHHVVRYGAVESTYRLEQYGICPRQTVLVRKACSHLERHFRRVNVMIRAVIEVSCKSDYRIACEYALLHCLKQTLLNCREEALRYRTADYALGERESVALAGGKLDAYMTVLTVTARLLLMLTFSLNRLLDSLAVCNLRLFEYNGRTETVL